jgi:ribosomal protein S4
MYVGQVHINDMRVMNARRTLTPGDVITVAIPIPPELLEKLVN